MRDPVCGMTVGPGALQVIGYENVAFCSDHCRQGFLADPTRYVRQRDIPMSPIRDEASDHCCGSCAHQ